MTSALTDDYIPSTQGANKYFEQQCANPTYEEELIKRAIQEVSSR